MSAPDAVRFRLWSRRSAAYSRIVSSMAKRPGPPGAAHLPQQALVHQFLQAVQHRRADVDRGLTDRLDDFQARAAGEH